MWSSLTVQAKTGSDPVHTWDCWIIELIKMMPFQLLCLGRHMTKPMAPATFYCQQTPLMKPLSTTPPLASYLLSFPLFSSALRWRFTEGFFSKCIPALKACLHRLSLKMLQISSHLTRQVMALVCELSSQAQNAPSQLSSFTLGTEGGREGQKEMERKRRRQKKEEGGDSH